MPAMVLSLMVWLPCSIGFARSCTRISGETLTSVQRVGSLPQTAMEDWVRGTARSVPLRTPEQLRQLQFHWGKPPPAADPSTRTLTAPSARRNQGAGTPFSASGDVEGNLHAVTELNRLRYFP